MFLKNKNIIFKIRRSKVTDYAALMHIKTPILCLLISLIKSINKTDQRAGTIKVNKSNIVINIELHGH